MLSNLVNWCIVGHLRVSIAIKKTNPFESWEPLIIVTEKQELYEDTRPLETLLMFHFNNVNFQYYNLLCTHSII